MSWVLGIVGAVLMSVLVDIILPNGQINKYVKGIFSLLFIYMLISPLITYFKNGVNFDTLNFESDAYFEDTNFLQAINTDRLEELKANTTKALEQNGIYNANIVIFSAGNNINLIDYAIVELRSRMDNDKKEKIEIIVSQQLGISKDKINIYAFAGNER